MAAFLDEKRWNERSQSQRLAKERPVRRRGKPLGLDKAKGNNALRKTRASDRTRHSEAKSPLSKYDVVPPLKPKHTVNHSYIEDDSWGEGSEYSDEDYTDSHHLTGQESLTLPPMSFALVPVQHPGYLNTKNSPGRQRKKRNHTKHRAKEFNPVRFASSETQIRGESPVASSGRYFSPAVASRPSHSHDSRYPYIYTTPRQPTVHLERQLLQQATHRFIGDPQFSQTHVNEFVDSQLKEEIIPDLFIEAINELSKEKSVSPVSQVSTSERSSKLFQFLPTPTSRAPGLSPDSQARILKTQANVSRSIVAELMNEVVEEEVKSVVRETCSERVQGLIADSKPAKMLNQLTDDLTADTTQSLLAEVKDELLEESVLTEFIEEPVLAELLINIAADTLEEGDRRQKGDEYKQLSKDINTKFLDGVLLDSFLERVIRQERVHINYSPSTNFVIDEIVLEVLLQRIVEIDYSMWEPLSVAPVRRYHEQAVTDVVMDMLLNELCLNLDEDMKDFDEYETALLDQWPDD